MVDGVYLVSRVVVKLSVGVDDSADCYQRTTRDNCCAAAAEGLVWLWRHMTGRHTDMTWVGRSLVLDRVSSILIE